MEREEGQHISQQKEKEAKKDIERIEAQLKTLAEAREKCYAQRKEADKPPLLRKIPDDEWKKIIEQWPCGPRRRSVSESEETELKDDDSSLNQPQEKGNQEKESSGLFGTQQLKGEDSVVSHQESMVDPQGGAFRSQ